MAHSADLQVVVGAGPVGSALARHLSEEGRRVHLLTRSGRDTGVPGVRPVAVDASDADALSEQTAGASVIYNCASPGAYRYWQALWPPLAQALLTAAERSGAVLVTASNLYGYGRVDAPIDRRTPLQPCDHKAVLRVQLWNQALAAHATGRVRVVEARASDYIGPTLPVSNSLLARYADATLRGETATVLADPDQPHTWTAIDDVASTLAALGRDERAWGSAWIVPSNPPVTVREVLETLADRAGVAPPQLRRMPRWTVRLGGLVSPMLREVRGVLYQFDAPFLASGAETTDLLGVQPMSWDGLMERTARAWVARVR